MNKFFKRFFITKRERMAMIVLNGMISADWNLPIPEGMAWDEVAVDRAYDIVDLLIKKN